MTNHPSAKVGFARSVTDVANIARPESVVMLAATVRAARELLRGERIDGLKERVSDGGYAVSSKDLAQRVLSTKV
jgi:anti-sigma28 factor (negative regulator of flagellin synthesis)